ncbi:MAG: cupin domain-containing protein [Candidatus Nealsonbacteria bacterium]
MKGFINNIEKLTLANNNFRKVLYTAKHSQLVLMSLEPGEEIGEEIHDTLDQFFRFEKGKGKVVIEGKESEITDGSAVVIPAGTNHNIINTSQQEALKLYTIYSPPNHTDGVEFKTKEEAEASDEHFDGKLSE